MEKWALSENRPMNDLNLIQSRMLNDLPKEHFENNTNALDLMSIGKNVYENYVEKYPGLKKEWEDVCLEKPNAFVKDYMLYVVDGTNFKSMHPNEYDFIKDHVFYGREYSIKGKDTEFEFMKPKVMELSNGDKANVYGAPLERAKLLDFDQGDNVYKFKGTCGLVSCENIIRQTGIKVSENEIVKFAKDNGLCKQSSDLRDCGSTNSLDRAKLLLSYGITTETNYKYTKEDVARAVQDGKGVILTVNDGILWQDKKYIGRGAANHAVTVTGVARDVTTNDIKGFYICDSGRRLPSDKARFVPIDLMEKAFKVPQSSLLTTRMPLSSYRI